MYRMTTTAIEACQAPVDLISILLPVRRPPSVEELDRRVRVPTGHLRLDATSTPSLGFGTADNKNRDWLDADGLLYRL